MLNTPGGFRALICALGLLQGSIKPSRALSAALIPEPTPHLSARVPSIGAVSYAKHLNSKDDSCYVAPYDSPPVDLQAFPSFDQAKATVYRYRQQQSVNMGSWYVIHITSTDLDVPYSSTFR